MNRRRFVGSFKLLGMKYRKLGKSDLMISRIGLGCMSIPTSNEHQGTSIIHRAIDLGINYFDTADLYERGLNETIVGKGIQGKRADVILATKVGNEWEEGLSGWKWNPHKEYIVKAIENSLQRLKTDYIDLYLLHGGTIEDPIEETIEAFELLVSQGKIRYYGISSIRPNVIREYVKRSNIVSVMMQYSLADRRPEEEILDLLSANDIGVLARGSLAQGMLVNKPAKDYMNHTIAEMEKAKSIIHSLVNDNRTASQTVIQYVLANPSITSAIVGFSRIEQLEEIAMINESAILSAAELKILLDALSVGVYEQYR